MATGLTILQDCGKALLAGDTKTYSLSKLLEEAKAASEEIENSPRPALQSPGFNLAFHEYCKADAYAWVFKIDLALLLTGCCSVQGWCYRKMAKQVAHDEDEKMNNLMKAYRCYYLASRCLPDDEEYRYST